jgi:hypothetical protein
MVNLVDGRTDAARVMKMNELAHVRRAADGVQVARTRLLATIVVAHEGGNALRTIAQVAGVSHEQVRLLLRKRQTN